MTVWMVVGVTLTSAVLVLTLRQTLPAYATVLSLAAGVLLLAAVTATAVPLIERITVLFDNGVMDSRYTDILMKALAITLLTQTAADICRDAGESALASKAELGGQVLLLLCGLPLFEYAVSLLESILHSQAVIP